MIKDSVRERVIHKLNAELGKDVKNLSKCKELVKKLGEEKENIEKEILKASKNLSSIETTNDIDSISHSIDEMTKEFNMISEIAKEKGNGYNESLNGLQSRILEVQQLEQGLCYLRCVRSIQELSGNIEMHLANGTESEAVAQFGLLCQMCGRLHQSKCAYLKGFLSDIIHHWHNVLKDMISIQLEEVLKVCGFPVVSSNVLVTPPSEAFARLQLIVKHLLNIQLPEELSPPPAVTSSLLANFPPISLPITLMLKPLRKRFIFHFCGSKQTNRPDKPEWFMTQVLSWIRDNEHFLVQWVQPVFNQTNQAHMLAQMEFTQGLVQLVVDKLHSDLPNLMFDDTLFSHAVDETLGFDKELRDSIGYSEALPSAVTVLTQAHVFVKWIHMERKYARDKMDAMLSSENAWAEVNGSEDLKVTEAAETFLTLLSTMTERYSILPQPGHRKAPGMFLHSYLVLIIRMQQKDDFYM